jgi:hypothetical protein
VRIMRSSFAKLPGKAGVPSTLSEAQSASALQALQASLAKHGVSAAKLTSLAGANALTPAPLDVFSTLAHPAS